MISERAVSVDHSTVRRWAVKLLPALGEVSERASKEMSRSWRLWEMGETCIKVKGECKRVSRTQARNL